jgi:hypothetical protein
MKSNIRIISKCTRSLLLVIFVAFSFSFSTVAASPDFYQIQVYHLTGKAQQEKMDNYLKTAYLPALHRAGIQKVGVFKPLESDTASGKVIYIWMAFKSLDQFAKVQDQLEKDKVYQEKGSDFLAAPFDQKSFVRKESILLKAFSEMASYKVPNFKTSPSERIYELRSYEGPTDYLYRQKVKMFNQGGEVKLFDQLDFNPVFFAEVISGSAMPNLMYLTTFEDMPSHDAHWKSFGNHPEWKKMSVLPEYQNTVSHADIILLHPTDYSDF